MLQFLKCCSQGNNPLLNPTLDKFHTSAASSVPSRICNCQPPVKKKKKRVFLAFFCNTNHLCFHSSFPVFCVSTSDLCLMAIGLMLFFSRTWQAAAWKEWLRVHGCVFLNSTLQLCFSKLPSIVLTPHITWQYLDIRPTVVPGSKAINRNLPKTKKTQTPRILHTRQLTPKT